MVILGRKKYKQLLETITKLNNRIGSLQQSIADIKANTDEKIKSIKDKLNEVSATLENNIEDITNRKTAEQIYEEYFFGEGKKDE